MRSRKSSRNQWWMTAAAIGVLAALANLSGCLAVAAGAGAGVGYAIGSQEDEEVDPED